MSDGAMIETRLQRYWRTQKLSLILAALVGVLFIVNDDWTAARRRLGFVRGWPGWEQNDQR